MVLLLPRFFRLPQPTLSFSLSVLNPPHAFCSETMDTVKQSAALCLLKLMRTAPDCVAFGEWTARVVHLLNDQHMGVVTAAVSLIETLVKRNPDEYKGCVSLAVSRLSRVRSLPLFPPMSTFSLLPLLPILSHAICLLFLFFLFDSLPCEKNV